MIIIIFLFVYYKMTYTKKRVSNLKKRNMSRKQTLSMRSKTRKVGQHSRKTKKTMKGGGNKLTKLILLEFFKKIKDEGEKYLQDLERLYKEQIQTLEAERVNGNHVIRGHGENCGNNNKGIIVFIPENQEPIKIIYEIQTEYIKKGRGLLFGAKKVTETKKEKTEEFKSYQALKERLESEKKEKEKLEVEKKKTTY